MKVARIIAGIVSIFAAIFILSWPGAGPAVVTWLVVLAMLVAGITMIINFALVKTHKRAAVTGAGTIALGIVLVVFSLLAIFLPGMGEMLAIVITICFIINLLFNGFSSIAAGATGASGMPVLSVIVGILMVIISIEGIVSIFVAAITMGVFIGIGLLIFGFSMFLDHGVDGEQQQ